MIEFISKFVRCRFEVIKKHWFKAEYATSKSINFHPEYSSICIIETITKNSEHELIIDIATGLFLVDGEPINQLPIEIVQVL